MSVSSDLDKGTTYGEADGPDVFVQAFGFEVPSFIDPRNDLKVKVQGTLMHHVPFQFRGPYKPEDLPEDFREARQFRLARDGYVLCNSVSASTGELCASRAMNRSGHCRQHAGSLHPCDKKMSGSNIVPLPTDRVARMDRVQQFMQGLINPADLDDDEVQNGYIRDSNGVPVKCVKLGAKIQAMLTKELHARLNDFLKSKAPSMLTTLVDIAENDLFEAADRTKAAIWVAERTIGKTPDVVYFGKTDAPYESVFSDSIESGSREDYRTQIQSSRLELENESNTIDAELVFDADNVEDSDNAQNAADDIEQRKADAKEARDRIKKAKQHRFAARANGATSLESAPWLIEYKQKGLGFTARLIPPDRQTPSVLARLAATT